MMKRLCLGIMMCMTVAGISPDLTAADRELNVEGDFQQPKKPGQPPLKWNSFSGSRGTLEYLRDEKGGSIMMTPAANSTLGIYSPAVPAAAGEKIRIEATVYGDKITVLLMQYAKGASSQEQQVSATREGKRIVCTFTVKDITAKGPTRRIRIGFKLKGSPATVADVKLFRIE